MKKHNVVASQTITNVKSAFQIIEGETSGGKKCLAILTDKRLSLEDFKTLMQDIRTAEGYGFTKYFPEHKTKLIAATKLDAVTLAALANQFVWSSPEPKATKPTKALTTKTDKEAKKTATKDITTVTGIKPEEIAEFQKFLAFKKSLGQ